MRVLADGGLSPFGGQIESMFGCAVQRSAAGSPCAAVLKARSAAAMVRRGGVEAVVCDSWKSLERLPAVAAPISCLAHGSEFPSRAAPGRAGRIRRA